MRRLGQILETVLVLLVMAGCDYREERYYAPEDQVGPDVVETTQYALFEQDCAGLRNEANTSCWSGLGVQQERDEVEMINRTRRRLGFGCAFPHNTLQGAARNHSTYTRHHSDNRNWNCVGTGHSERVGCELFTGVNHHERIIAAGGYPSDTVFGSSQEVISDSAPPMTPQHSVCGLFLDAPFHHAHFLISEMERIGAGYNESRQGVNLPSAVYTVNWAEMAGAARKRAYFPAPGSSGNRRSTDASTEIPTPPNCASGWPNCGALVSIRAPNATVTGTAFCRKEANGTCTHVPHVALTSAQSPSFVPPDTGMLYAHSKLDASTVYRVQFFINQCGLTTPEGFPLPCRDEAPWWEFMTGPGAL